MWQSPGTTGHAHGYRADTPTTPMVSRVRTPLWGESPDPLTPDPLQVGVVPCGSDPLWVSPPRSQNGVGIPMVMAVDLDSVYLTPWVRFPMGCRSHHP